MSELETVLFQRRTIHEYLDAPLPKETLHRALAAAQMAPCHKLTWPWRFIQVGPQTRARLTELTIEVKGQKRTMTPELEERIRRRTTRPAVLLAVAQVRSIKPKQAQEDYAAIAMAIQNLSLSLERDGFGSKWSTGAVTTHPNTYAMLQLDPSAFELVGFIWAGKAAAVPEPPKRPALADIFRTIP